MKLEPDPQADAFAEVSSAFALKRLLNETVGTFLLVFIDCGGAMIGAAHEQVVTPFARSLATGLLVMSLVYALGNVSGAHLNPAVTLAFATRQVFPWRRVPFYWGAQILGALLAVASLRSALGDVEHLGATLPGPSVTAALAFEIFLTGLLVLIILGTATRHRVVGPNAAIAVGGAVALCGLFARPISGASMNPARSVAPALLSGTLEDLWIYVAGPAVGALLAVAVIDILHPNNDGEEPMAVGDCQSPDEPT